MYTKLVSLEKKKSKILGAIALLLLLSAFGKLIVSSTLAGRGQDLSELEAEAARLTRENRLIQEELAKSASLAKVASGAAQLGLVKQKDMVYVKLSDVKLSDVKLSDELSYTVAKLPDSLLPISQ